VHFTNLSDVLSRFNGSSLETCVLGLVDEVTLGSTHNGQRDAQSSVLKALITEDTHRIEDKFLPAERKDSYLNLICHSNHQHALHVEAGERRYFALQVDGIYAGPTTPEAMQYFNAL